MATEKVAKVATKYECLVCDYTTQRKSSYDKHISTPKHNSHVSATNGHNIVAFNCENCDKNYKDRTGLWKHKKKCVVIKDTSLIQEPTDKELIMMLLKEHAKKSDELSEKELIMMLIKKNDDLQSVMMEVIKNGTHNTTTTTTTNSHNKAFNLNFFLNETCKDAMNITDFVNSIQLQLSDLERMGEVGYVEGLSSIISRNLKALDVNMRPVHCTDKKREIMYIKDETKWEKDEENVKMHKMVRNVAFENQRQILKYKEIHPDCGKSSSKYSDPYNKILVECMGGAGDNDFEKEEKIIRKISKCVVVEKEP
jgi:hypothetical protein